MGYAHGGSLLSSSRQRNIKSFAVGHVTRLGILLRGLRISPGVARRPPDGAGSRRGITVRRRAGPVCFGFLPLSGGRVCTAHFLFPEMTDLWTSKRLHELIETRLKGWKIIVVSNR